MQKFFGCFFPQPSKCFLSPSAVSHLFVHRGTNIAAVSLAPTAKCKDVVLVATANCAARSSAEDLITAIDNGSIGGLSPTTLVLSLTPAPGKLHIKGKFEKLKHQQHTIYWHIVWSKVILKCFALHLIVDYGLQMHPTRMTFQWEPTHLF